MSQPEGRFDVTIDDARRRVTVSVTGLVSGSLAAERLAGLIHTRPETTGYDFLFDMRDYEGGIGHDDAELVAEANRRHGPAVPAPTRTAFVTDDESVGLWTVVMDFQFANRRHRAFRTVEEAAAFLDAPR